MNGPIEGYITLQAAADLLGLSRSTLYRRALAAEQFMNSSEQPVNSSLNSGEQPVNSKPSSIVKGKKRYISMDYVQALQQAAGSAPTGEQFMNSGEQFMHSSLNSAEQFMNSSADSLPGTLGEALQRVRALERSLLEAQGKLAVLEATNAALQGQLDYHKQQLDREQMIRLAAEQRKLTAGAGGLFAWIRRKTKGNP